ncbi:MAG: glycoside hydrolase family 97 catalytic domain-containing protein [Muribaculaceae bacterium]
MKHYRSILSIIVVAMCWAATGAASLVSPDGKLRLEAMPKGQSIALCLLQNGREVMQVSTLQFAFARNNVIKGDYEVVDCREQSHNSQWQTVYGEQAVVTDCYNALTLDLQSKENAKRLTLEVRLYNEGMAFRYGFDSTDFWHETLTDECSRFVLPGDAQTWVTDRAQGVYQPTTIAAMRGEADRPQVVRLASDCYVAIGEAALVDFARMKLKHATVGEGIQSALSGKVQLHQAGYMSPWRYAIVGSSPSQIVQQNYMVLNLNEPCRIADTAWIKPGKVIREVTLTTEGGLACVDFAAAHGIEYVEYDAGWYGPENDPASDATTITVDPARSKGILDLHRVIDYANSKGVGIILYVNQKALTNQLDDILPLFEQWGVKGVKYGFVDVGDQYSTSWLHHAVRKAAKYHLMVDIHDEYRPTGYSRTYPNLITQEGIRGDEESPSLQHSILTLYNRMLCGAGDNTNCYFSERVTEKMSGRAAQLAKLVSLYSPWQFIYWYDRPQASPRNMGGAGSVQPVIEEDNITSFYTSVPTVWLETLHLEGEMGQYSVVARRSGNEWYVAVMNAGDRRTVSVPLSRLGITQLAEAVLYHQASPKRPQEVNIKRLKAAKDGAITFTVGASTGAVLHLKTL